MKEIKKLKLNKLNFYIVEESYIKYLSQFGKHIAYNKSEKRPYVGIVFIVNNHYYFAPLFSPKPQHKKYKNNSTIFKIKNPKTKTYLGIIRFSDMIPVPIENIDTTIKHNRMTKFYKSLSCNYKLLEEKCTEYNNKIN